MRRLALVTLVLAAALAPAALAKEPTAALISGPGLSDPISLDRNRSAEARVMLLAEGSGFFPGVFGRTPDPMLEVKPTGDLGPRYTVVYRLPGPGSGSRIVQDVYPYATPAAVTYMEPGQIFWDGQRTRGGWFMADTVLRTSLVQVGLPSSAPGRDDTWSWRLTALVAAAGAALLALILLFARRRLRTVVRPPQAV